MTIAARLRHATATVATVVLGAVRAGAQTPAPAPAAQIAPAAPVAQAPASSATRGLVVPAGSTTSDDIIVLRGPVDVYGTVDGDAIVVSGDLVVHPGGKIDGDAVSVFGHVRTIGSAIVTGDTRSVSDGVTSRRAAEVAPAPETQDGTWHALKLVLGWLTILLIIGVGVLVTAGSYLDGVAEAFELSFARALGIGIIGQMLVLPALLALVVALALTLVGILAIPLAVVAFAIAVAGVVTLGFLAVSYVTGRSIRGGERGIGGAKSGSLRGDAARSLGFGVAVYLAPWLAAAALESVPYAAVVLRTIALATSWVAATAGFGAAIASRAGTRGAGRKSAAPPGGADPYASASGWQTPTPVSGVVAARRPAAVPSARD